MGGGLRLHGRCTRFSLRFPYVTAIPSPPFDRLGPRSLACDSEVIWRLRGVCESFKPLSACQPPVTRQGPNENQRSTAEGSWGCISCAQNELPEPLASREIATFRISHNASAQLRIAHT